MGFNGLDGLTRPGPQVTTCNQQSPQTRVGAQQPQSILRTSTSYRPGNDGQPNLTSHLRNPGFLSWAACSSLVLIHLIRQRGQLASCGWYYDVFWEEFQVGFQPIPSCIGHARALGEKYKPEKVTSFTSRNGTTRRISGREKRSTDEQTRLLRTSNDNTSTNTTYGVRITTFAKHPYS